MAGFTELFADGAATTLNGAISTTPAAGTSETWTVTSTAAPFSQANSGATPPTQFTAIVDSEEITVSNTISTTQWTVLRGANGTTPATHANGATVTQVVTSQTIRRATSDIEGAPRHRGFSAWTCRPVNAGNTLNTSATGRICLFRIYVPETITVNNITGVVTAAGATLTSAQNLAGVYNSSGTLLGSTADQSTTWTSTGLKTMAMSSSFSVTGGPDVYVYGALLAVGTTIPIWAAAGGVNTALINAGLPANTWVASTWTTAQTSLPSTITLSNFSTALGGMIWLALS